MKNEITISELAKLMNVSIHQIRYFEEKGVLLPAYTDDNQYRLYSIEQVYQLAHILLLRKLGVSVQSIKECMTTFSADQYDQLLHRSLRKIEVEIQRLQELQQFIQKVQQEQKNLKNMSTPYHIKRRDTTYFTRWMEMDIGTKLSAKQLAAQTKSLPNLFELDLHFICDGSNTVSFCLETQKPGDLCLPEGNYLVLQCSILEDDELDQAIERFYDYAAAHSYVPAGPLILIEKSYLSLFSNNELHYELQVLLDAGAHFEGGAEYDSGRNNG
ncbi:MerR family transcriptional regulator [Paenibacillus sp. ACRRX]|uniref:MerR family transcriptional regulator n=1 Tax=Paenibacillus sp. ACRRX TaxID=2918206 RepID=UPI001EF625BB|nr:MerR family transcriptional regulator [Paenibacillus sp. ACRRX]